MISKSIAQKKRPLGLILVFGADVVLRLVENLPKNQNFKIFFDNFYSSSHLAENLQQMGIGSVVTVRIDRMRKAKLPALEEDQNIRKLGRGLVDR